MDFTLSDTQQMLQDMVSRYVGNEYSFEQRNATIASGLAGSARVWHAFAELGLAGIPVSEQFGGIGGGFHDIAIVMEQIGRGLLTIPFLPTVVLGSALIEALASADQKRNLLGQLAAGDLRVALAHFEPGMRYDAFPIAAKAMSAGDGFIIDGVKVGVLGGDEAALLLVSAMLGDAVRLFAIPADTDGLTIRRYRNLDDTGSAEIHFSGVAVSAAQALDAGDAAKAIEETLDRGTAALCAEAVGAMAELNALSLEYIKTRQQFGVPLGSFQVLQHAMVDMTLAEEMARSMAIGAADAIERLDGAECRRMISAAKAQVSTAARAVGEAAMQLHGAVGFTSEYSGGHYYRRLIAISQTFGDADWHLSRMREIQPN